MEMDVFCNTVINYIKTEEAIERIIALILQDIFMNELIYVQYFDVWKQYDMANKMWYNFEVKEFHNKLWKLRDFFLESLPMYIEKVYNTSYNATGNTSGNTSDNTSDKLTPNEKYYLLKYIRVIEKYIITADGERAIIDECKRCFHITV
jgi:hypothetical protein